MRPSLSALFQDEAWQQIAADIEDLVRELVDQKDSHTMHVELKRRLVRRKVDQLKQRLGNLKQSLQQELERLEQRLLLHSSDAEARSLVALGSERLADMWLMESLLDRLASPSGRRTERAGALLSDAPSGRPSPTASPSPTSRPRSAGEAV